MPRFQGIKSSWPFRFGVNLAAGYLNYEIQNVLTHLPDALFARNDSAGIHVNDIRHALR